MGSIMRRLFEGVANFFYVIFNIGVRLKFVLILCIVLTGGSIFITYYKVLKDVGGKDDYEEAMRYIEIKDVLDEQFIDEVDRKTMGEDAAAAMVSGLGDGWSYYMTEEEYRTYQLNSSGEYGDIGITIVRDEVSGGFQVVSVDPESPAGWAGVMNGMVISTVDEQDVRNMELDDVRTLIRSKMNKEFNFGMNNGQFSLTVDCSSSYASPVTYRLEKTEAGYVKIDSFEAGSGEDAVKAIEDLLSQNAVALCIDLRGNPGGLTSELMTFLDYLLPSGTLFYEVDKDGHKTVTESDGMCIQLPMCVLINGETYAEAEVCAAVLQEHKWATLIGEATKGNTRTQETVVLSDGSAIRLSTKCYMTPNGVDLTKQGGVVPDIIVLNTDAAATGTTEGTTGASDGTSSISKDDQLNAALRQLS